MRVEMALVAEAPTKVSYHNASRSVWSRTGGAVPRVLANEADGDRSAGAGTRKAAAEATRHAPGPEAGSDPALDLDASGVSTPQRRSHSDGSQSPDAEPGDIATGEVVWWWPTIPQA